MATERNPTGEEGDGLSGMGDPGYGAERGTGHADTGVNAGTSGSAGGGYGGGMGSTGTGGGAEVHSDVSVGRDAGTYSAIAVSGSVAGSGGSTGGGEGLQERVTSRVRDMAGQVRERAQGMMEGVPERLSGATGQARERAGQALGRAETLLEERGILNTIRENPLPALGIAFGVGFLLAGSSDRSARGPMQKARNQLRGAIMGGLTAAVAQEARGLLGQSGGGGAGGLLHSILGNLQGGSSQGRTGGTDAPARRPPSHRENL
ncbi:MAG TPA: hypothetical protein VHG28_03285 [Longimicrobiaceae bacterium]|nr:hypothetical protein [Longimicrobiaceae bacterium]